MAARLAHAGFQVDVYEKNSFSGGGPSLFLMPQIFLDTFTDLGESFHDHVQLSRCDPNYRLHFHDGDTLELSSDLATMRDQLERIEPGAFERWLAFERASAPHYDLSVKNVLSWNFKRLLDMATWRNVKMLPRLHIHLSLYRFVSSFFKSDKLRKAFSFQSMYMGMSPYDAPATYSLLQYTEFAEGIWYPIGGYHKVVDSLEQIARKRGARFHYNARNPNSSDSANEVRGITLEDGTQIDADLVVCNADLVWAYTKLLPRTKYTSRLENLDQTSSSFSFYWGLNRTVPELLAHNIFLAEHYRDSFDDIFVRNSLPAEPSFYIHVPSRMDPSAAPVGKDAVTVLVPTGILTPAAASDPDVMHQLYRLGVPDFSKLIESEVVNTPETWREKFNLYKGSILGLSHSVPQVLWFRPSTSHALYDNLYFVGASTHPGTGVPVVLYGARTVAGEIVEKYGATNKSKVDVSGKLLGGAVISGGWTVLVALIVAVFALLVSMTMMAS
ncbi:hypothetical protein BCR44DRAFT_1479970 [Catenaria anguillulae PL171]|uniref:Phytoene desaturase n=1 Tax=Catenaria anguillulae PL171 TaxID=765915 RepID=A0A1Y2HHM8_9FUNG|nr:hypothetical protein BCR44DRAFT_1479970 [Catenaria anguillulae PL171]